MERLNNDRFEYLGKIMPIEFSEICKLPEFENDIRGRKKNPFRFYDRVNDILKWNKKPTISDYAKKFKYPTYIKDLFNMSESEFKFKHPDEWVDFFVNLPKSEQKKQFKGSDFGARSIFEHHQDVLASNVLEDAIADSSFGALKPNPAASGRFSNEVSTNCDFLFETPEGFKNHVCVPIELKTKWTTSNSVFVRGSAKKIKETGGMILLICVKENKAAVVDISNGNYPTRRTFHMGKEGDEITFPEELLHDFKFWDEGDMRNLLNEIYKLYQKRGQ